MLARTDDFRHRWKSCVGEISPSLSLKVIRYCRVSRQRGKSGTQPSGLFCEFGYISPIAIFLSERGDLKSCRANQDKVRASQARRSQFKSSQIKPNPAKSRRFRLHQVRSKYDHISCQRGKSWSQAELIMTKSGQVKPNEVNSNQAKKAQSIQFKTIQIT